MVDSDSDTPGERLAEAGGLDLLEGEAAAGSLLQVVLWGGGRVKEGRRTSTRKTTRKMSI